MSADTVSRFFAEDLGPANRDVSVLALGEAAHHRATGRVKAKADGILCGGFLVTRILREAETRFAAMTAVPGTPIEVSGLLPDGSSLTPGTIIATLSGPTGALLIAERTLLNLLQRLSGVSTLSRAFVDRIKGTDCRILDTRKTTPGLRELEKRAVRVGGGVNHRLGLYDMIMLKDNHVAAMGGDIVTAVEQSRRLLGPSLKIEVETSSLTQVQAAVKAKADLIMLDNMSPAQLRECVVWVAGRVPLEASGGITLDTVRAVAESGVDYISVGALTHSAPALDISMKISLTGKV